MRCKNVAKVYRKSLLYLVSRALERAREKPIFGMEKYAGGLPSIRGLEFIYSNGRADAGSRCASTTHGGFDNDPKTMNDILELILGEAPAEPFTAEDLSGF